MVLSPETPRGRRALTQAWQTREAHRLNNPVPAALGGLALVGVSFATTLGEHLDGVIRIVTLFTLLGTMIAYRRYQRHPSLDPFPIVTRWSIAGLSLGVLVEVLIEVVRALS